MNNENRPYEAPKAEIFDFENDSVLAALSNQGRMDFSLPADGAVPSRS